AEAEREIHQVANSPPAGPAPEESGGLRVPASLLGRIAASLAQAKTGAPGQAWHWPEWLAMFFLAGVMIGLLRFAIGLLAVRRLRRRSCLLSQPALERLLASLFMAM